MLLRNVFAGPYLDRAAHLRQDPDWFAAAIADASSRVVPVWNSRSLVAGEQTPRAAFLELDAIPHARRGISDLILLGRFQEASYFAYEIESIEPPALSSDGRFEDLRLVASLLPPDEAGLLGYARALISWRRRNRFCGTCGTVTVPARGGACGRVHEPRMSP